MSKEKNIDSFSPFLVAVQNNAVIVSVVIGEDRFPPILSKITPWVMELSEDCLEIFEEKGKLDPVVTSIQKKSKHGIKKVEIGLVKKMQGGTGVQLFKKGINLFNMALRMEFHFLYDEESIVLLCEGFTVAPKLIEWLKAADIAYEDPFHLEELFSKPLTPSAGVYIERNFSSMLQAVKDKKYHVPYMNFVNSSSDKKK